VTAVERDDDALRAELARVVWDHPNAAPKPSPCNYSPTDYGQAEDGGRVMGEDNADGERERFLDLITSLLDTYRPEGVLIWLTSGNRDLGGYSPRDLIRDGEWDALLEIANRLAGGPSC
jgi:hypothetical protein